MKYLLYFLLLTATHLSAVDASAKHTRPTTTLASADDPYLQVMAEKWENSCQYTRELIEAMPADLMEYRMSEEVRTFKEQIVNICNNIQWLTTTYLNGKEVEGAKPETKEELLSYFDRVAKYSQEALENFDPNQLEDEAKDFFAGKKSKRQIVNLLQDHHTHHRGQAIMYLRMNKVKPPRYRGW